MYSLANPWNPMTKAIDLKHLGKLGEEAGELSAIVCRCIIQGINEYEPVTGKSNREALEDEIADVQSWINALRSLRSNECLKIIGIQMQITLQ